MTQRTRILVIGGYGAFGTLICERLALAPDLHVLVAGRSREKAVELAARLRTQADAIQLDTMTADAAAVHAIGAHIVINASGPFQNQDYTLARAALSAGCHYVDLADARSFVTGITALDASARQAGVSVISGASSVPGLSSAVYTALRPRFSAVTALEIYLSPGNHFNPGEATTRSVLGGAGRPIAMLQDGRFITVYGWQGLRRRTIAGIGTRWFGYVDVPDLDLFPAADPALRTVCFQAGVEVSAFHLGLWALAGLKRAAVIADVGRLTRPLMWMKERLAFLGSDRGGMLMTLSGTGHDGRPLHVDWSLAATDGHGPHIPTIASVILAKRLARDRSSVPAGAMPCFGLFTLDDFMREIAGLKISATTHVRAN